jgi:glycogen operon protein
MSEGDWQAGFAKSLAVFLNGRAIPTPNERGERVVDESFYVMFNAHHEPIDFTLPEAKWGTKWIVLLNTAENIEHMTEEEQLGELEARGTISVKAWSLVLLRRTAWE